MDRQVSPAIISFRPSEMTGWDFYSPATATDFLFIVQTLDFFLTVFNFKKCNKNISEKNGCLYLRINSYRIKQLLIMYDEKVFHTCLSHYAIIVVARSFELGILTVNLRGEINKLM